MLLRPRFFFWHFRAKASLFPRAADPKSESFAITYPLQGCVLRPFISIWLSPGGDSIQVLPAVSFWKRERYLLSYRGRAYALYYFLCVIHLVKRKHQLSESRSCVMSRAGCDARTEMGKIPRRTEEVRPSDLLSCAAPQWEQETSKNFQAFHGSRNTSSGSSQFSRAILDFPEIFHVIHIFVSLTICLLAAEGKCVQEASRDASKDDANLRPFSKTAYQGKRK